ncbi:hypothetical protein [Empedobacter sp.]|uniref:hypothetical protein n=1 Tax=Empedobacter sp. TaxID=1927715 RepID=UPI0028AEBE64|nr:hypothetical protein [Empedobacter sp.]
MTKKITYILLFISSFVFAQNKAKYLESNRFDLTKSDLKFPQNKFNLIGFGAYHGSAKTENVEINLLNSILKNNSIKYYLPETDFSIAHYFNEYLKTGDTHQLKDLVTQYGVRVPQERTIEVFNKWKNLKKINDKLPNDKKIKVVGIDLQVNYKYVSKHILELTDNSDHHLEHLNKIEEMVKIDTTSFSMNKKGYAYKVLKDFVNDYEIDKSKYENHIINKFDFEHIIKNLKISFSDKSEREKVMYDNYLSLDSKYDFKNKPQFLRMGFFHLEKAREGEKGYPSFFARLIENNIYTKEKIISVIGFLTNSRVVWDEKYDTNGKYVGHTTEAGMGIGDYEKEYFRGIQNLKATKISDETLFRLNKRKSPYFEKEPDLIEVIMKDEESNGKNVSKMSTLDFLDYAVLISNSEASIPIFEIK